MGRKEGNCIFCTQCGSKNGEYDRFCTSCGAALKRPSLARHDEKPAEPPAESPVKGQSQAGALEIAEVAETAEPAAPIEPAEPTEVIRPVSFAAFAEPDIPAAPAVPVASEGTAVAATPILQT